MERECEHKNLIRTQKETYCRDCGEVFPPEMFGGHQEFNDKKGKDLIFEKEFTHETYYDKNIGSMVGNDRKDAFGRKLTSKEIHRAFTLKKYERESKRYILPKFSSFIRGINMIDVVVANVSAPGFIKDSARLIYKKAHALDDCLRGRSVEVVVIASVLLAYKENNMIPPPIQNILEIIIVNRISKNKIDNAIKYLKSKKVSYYVVDKIEICLNSNNREEIVCYHIRKILEDYGIKNSIIVRTITLIRTRSPNEAMVNRTVKFMKKRLKIYPINPQADVHIKHYSARLGLTQDIISRALDICKIFEDVKENNKKSLIEEVDCKKKSLYYPSPTVLAAGSLYQAVVELRNGESAKAGMITQKILGDTAGITEVSIRNTVKWLRAAIEIWNKKSSNI